MPDQDEMFRSIREEFPSRNKRQRRPRDPNSPGARDFLGSLFQSRERDFTGVQTLQDHDYDSGANTQLPEGSGQRTEPLPVSKQVPPPPTSRIEGNRRNVAIPLSSPAGQAATSGINKLESNMDSGSASGGPNVGNDVRVPKESRLVIGFGGGGGVTAGVVNGQTVLTSDEGDILPATNELGRPNRVADTNMSVETANRILNQDTETTARYQDIKWTENLSPDINDYQSRSQITAALSDMGYAPSSNRKFSEAQRLSHVVYDYEAENGLNPKGLVNGQISADTLRAIKDDVEVMHRLQQDLLR